jgi:hypothetical protein
MSRPAKPAHYRGTYHVRSRALLTAANANPATVCWRCGRTLDQHPAHRNGKRPWWTAGHVIPGEVNGELQPEASTCNYRHGGRLRHAHPTTHPNRREWWTT